MSLPTVSQTWTYSMNNRFVFSSTSTLINTTGAFMFSFIGVGGFLPTTMGYTVKGSCDGTTGAMDGVNRITAANKWATRGATGASAQSWIVLTDGAGIDWCFSYNSSGDDIVRLAHSQGGVYVVAGTANQQPTATDECFDTASGSWVNSTLSADRVWHFWGSADKKMWRVAVYRLNALISFMKGEKFLSALVSPATFTLATGGGTQAAIKSYYIGTNINNNVLAGYSASGPCDLARVHSSQDVNVKACVGGELIGGMTGSGGTLSAERPALQGALGSLIFPSQLGSIQGFSDGKLGSVYDQWYCITNSLSVPGVGDTFGNLQFYSITPGIIIPLDGSTVPVTG